MKNINRRLYSIEKRLRIGKHSKTKLPSVIIIGGPKIAEDEQRPELRETCTTEEQQLQAYEGY